ncbi:MAG TPA: VOC family protein, partial [Cyclobacteriaceae bacterium]
DEQDKIMNITLSLGNGFTLMATDALPSMEQYVSPGNSFHINIVTESEEEADKLFELLSEGGTVEMPLDKAFWGSYFGKCRDKFEVSWMINYHCDQNQKA